MISLLDIAERVQKGPKMDENDWNMVLFHKLQALTQKYAITYPGDGSYFNFDPQVAERAFNAAIEFLVDMGVYCVSTRRVVKFEEHEIRAAIDEAPCSITVGEGRDARILRQRKLEGDQPLNQIPGMHAPFSEELAPLIVKNYAQIAHGDLLEGFNFAVVDGRKIFGIATEAYAAKREVAWMREGIRKAGRPGMAIAYYPINTKASTLIAPIDPHYGLRPTDGVLLSTLPDSKMELDLLTAAIVYDEYGCFKINGGSDAGIGGFCGGAEGAAIEALAKTICGWLVYRDEIHVTGPYDLRYTTAKKMEVRPEKHWAISVQAEALTKHTNFICFGGNASQSGPGTEEHLLELGILAIQHAITGANLYICRQGRARMDASESPLEPECMFQVANATIRAGINRQQGDAIIRKLAEDLDGRDVQNGPDDIRECYDLVYHRPKEEYGRIYDDVKKRFNELGVPV